MRRFKRRRQYKPVSEKVRVSRLLQTALKRAPADKETLRGWISALVKDHIGSVCRYCGVVLCLANCSLDHKTPLSRGGENAQGNLQLLCRRCNQAKGAFTAEEFAAIVEATRGRDPYCKQYLYTRLMAATRVFRRWRR